MIHAALYFATTTAAACCLCAATVVASTTTSPSISATDESHLLTLLHDGLTPPTSWISIHAAEALLDLHHPQIVANTFRSQSAIAPPPFRIGVWRVLARAERDPALRNTYVDRIRHVLLDPAAPDRLHAMEAMAKLDQPLATDAERRYVTDTAAGTDPAAPFALWRLAQANDASAIDRLATLLKSPDPVARYRAAYVLSRLRPLAPATAQAVAAALAIEPPDSIAHPALVLAAGGRGVVDMATRSPSAPSRALAATDLALHGAPPDRAALAPLLDDTDLDVRIAAAYAILRLHRASTTATAPAP